jgi:hypothetical protein
VAEVAALGYAAKLVLRLPVASAHPMTTHDLSVGGREQRCPNSCENERDARNILHAASDKTACAPFIKLRRMKFGEATEPHRKSVPSQGRWRQAPAGACRRSFAAKK